MRVYRQMTDWERSGITAMTRTYVEYRTGQHPKGSWGLVHRMMPRWDGRLYRRWLGMWRGPTD